MILGDAGKKIWRKYVMALPPVIAKAIRKLERHYFPPFAELKPVQPDPPGERKIA